MPAIQERGLVKVVLNPRYEIVDIEENPDGERIYTIKRRKKEEYSVDSEMKNERLKV